MAGTYALERLIASCFPKQYGVFGRWLTLCARDKIGSQTEVRYIFAKSPMVFFRSNEQADDRRCNLVGW